MPLSTREVDALLAMRPDGPALAISPDADGWAVKELVWHLKRGWYRRTAFFSRDYQAVVRAFIRRGGKVE